MASSPAQIYLQTRVQVLASRLRSCDPPVVGRIQDDRFLIDPRTLSDDDEESLLQALRQVLV